MRLPSQQDITVDPELAVLNVLDAATDMAIAVLMVFHRCGDDPEIQSCRSHRIANRIIDDAHRLRQSLADYDNALHLDRGSFADNYDFPF